VVDVSSPTVTFNPVNSATGVSADSNITITFDEPVRNTDDTALTDTNSSGSDITFDATTDANKQVITINPTSDFSNEQVVYVAIGTTVEDSTDHAISATSVTFTVAATGGETNPTLSSSSPSDGATGVDINADIILTFSEDVVVGTGNITIQNSSDDSVLETISVTSSKVTGTGTTAITINPTEWMLPSTGYHININATAFDDKVGNSYAGISDSKTLNFTTTSLMPDPRADKDIVGSIEAQIGIAKRFIRHSTRPVLARMEWLRRHRKERNLSHQGITLTFADPMIDKVSRVFSLSTYINPTAELLLND
jgi:methionine-rich copper-binding protein CopC